MVAKTVEGEAGLVVDSCTSTNDLARKLGDRGAPHGSWISARRQSAGRGRLGRSWLSEEGGLYLSLLYRSPDRAGWTWIPLVTAIGVVRALRSLDPSLDVTIKWPNDLWIGRGGHGAKLGGILCEAVGSREQSYVIVGIGINCASSPAGLDQRTASLSASGRMDRDFSVDRVRAAVVGAVLEIYEELRTRRGPDFAVEYEACAALPRGECIEWGDAKRGSVAGLGDSGELRVLPEGGGSVLSLYAEDVKVRAARKAGGESPA